ncbi:hypothetical protein BDZ90DRAFT_232533 [Jaminaea rosea]|uniref:Uncharacterized protein n=1 Tax=Jaminaea rosea TaxID=1569628 RepID=A0A316UT90_9BASI|nr:hypothetical protein BDZ90DRAFT_232533 [Jaminaea rosea]PWN27561.1 hypothetical protein BDZ90DRAFT_232533 [Jaminaea rosea]
MAARSAHFSDWTAPVVPDSALSYRGILTPSDIQLLHSSFDSVVLVPGLTGPFGRKTDRSGTVRIPGSMNSLREATKRLSGWQEKNGEGDRLQWWLEQLRHKGQGAMTVCDVLNGISLDTWQSYQQLYQKCVNATAQQRYRQRKRRAALAREEAEHGHDGPAADAETTATAQSRGQENEPAFSASNASDTAVKHLTGRRKRRRECA